MCASVARVLDSEQASRNGRPELRSDITILDACDTEMRITAFTKLRSQVRVPGRGRSRVSPGDHATKSPSATMTGARSGRAANSFCRGGFGHPAGFGSLTGYQVWNRMHG
jgi:hypothetical protein